MSSNTVLLHEKTSDLPSHGLSFLIVAAERGVRDMCKEVAEEMGFRVRVVESTAAALRVIETYPVDLALLDWRLAGAEGMDLLLDLRHDHPQTEVAILTANATADFVLTAMKCGAFDFLRKPFYLDELRALLERAVEHLQSSVESRVAREALRGNTAGPCLIGRSREMEKLHRIIAKVAPGRHSVLILGEAGTGKEMVARAIHSSGPYSDKPFVPVDCDSLAPMLMENELFGCAKLASSNGTKPREGVFTLAHGGTVFLNEVGKLSMDIQAKLLRAMQDKEIRPVGANKAVPFDVRIVAASSQDLNGVMDQGIFRRELYFRLNVVNLRLPPLRERPEDIRLLTEHFLEGLSARREAPLSISPEAFRLLRAYSWPGNLHELEGCLQRAAALSPGRVLEVRDLPVEIRTFKAAAVTSASRAARSRIVSLAEMEKHAILTALEQLNGDKIMTAKLLGLGKTTLYRKLKEYGIAQSVAPSNGAKPVTPSNGTKPNGVKHMEAR